MMERSGAQPKITGPAFRYCGGKFTIASWIAGFLPEHKMYVEPFGGAASVLLRKPPAVYEIYNDINEEIVNYFRVIRDQDLSNALISRLRLTPYSRLEYHKACKGEAIDQVDRALLFAIRQNMSFNGQIFAQKGSFRTECKPRGKSIVQSYYDWVNQLDQITQRFKHVIIENRDIFWIIEKYDNPDCLFYCDPPYLNSVRIGMKNLFKRHEFQEERHVELAKALRGLKGMAIISGRRCDLYDELYSGWRRFDKYTRGLRCKARQPESIWLSPNIPDDGRR
jgi:DNA adenine methylase